MIYEAIAMLIALTIYLQLTMQRKLGGAAFMTAGVLLTLIAAALQASKAVTFTMVWQFDHNGDFHLAQMVGVLMLVAGLRRALDT